jgi:hypothetical protein
MSALARRALTIALTAAVGMAGFFQVSIAADAQSAVSTQNETAAPVQRAKGPLEILLSQHQQRARSGMPAQSAGAQSVSGSDQANAVTLSAGLPAVATPPLDVQPSAPLGTANDVRRDVVASASANPGAAPVSQQAASLGRDLPAVSNQSKELAQPTNNAGEGDQLQKK